MALTKRTRFEVLRRDNHACRYCGATAPDAKLTVDHVTPVALGGTDDPTNLVTACAGCNAGKSSTGPDSHLVADVREDALRHAERTRQAYAVLVEQIGKRVDYEDAVYEAYGYHPPADWRASIGRFYEMGVPVELVIDAATKATDNVSRFTGDGRWRWMCGVVWNQARAVGEAVARNAALDGMWVTEEALSIEAFEGYRRGRETGYREGHHATFEAFKSAILGAECLHRVIDGPRANVDEALRHVLLPEVA